MFRINITKWLQREIAQTEYALLKAEDEAADAALRVKALQQRVTRLKGKLNKREAAPERRHSVTEIVRAASRKAGAA
jgi:HEPN domain-containing protein